jgi:hypothetical protein
MAVNKGKRGKENRLVKPIPASSPAPKRPENVYFNIFLHFLFKPIVLP